MKKFLDQVVNSVRYQEPDIYATEEEWINFVNKAGYKKVLQAYEKNQNNYVLFRERCNLIVMLTGLRKGDWPKLSDSFVQEYEDDVYRVKTSETAKDEVYKNYEDSNPKYLVDEANQLLGIVVDRDIIISGIPSVLVSQKVALDMKDFWLSAETMDRIAVKAIHINKLLDRLGYDNVNSRYWIAGNCSFIAIWLAPHCSRFPLGDDEYAKMLFLL